MAAPAASSSQEEELPPLGLPIQSSAHLNSSTRISSSPNQTLNSPWHKVTDSQSEPAKVHIAAGVAHTTIPDNVVYDSQPLWSDCIVGYFIDEPPYVGKIHATINRLWRTKKQAETKGTMIVVDFLNPTTALFRIPNKQSREFILGKHVWHIGTTPMVVQQWSPSTAKSAPDMTRIPVWVDFSGVPDVLYAEKGLKFLGDIVGKYQSIHSNTEKCLNLEVARVLALVNFEKELINTIVVNDKEGTEITIKVSYPWVPLKCGLCNKWGHGNSKCPDHEQNLDTDGTNVNKGTGETEPEMQPGQSIQNSVSKSVKKQTS